MYDGWIWNDTNNIIYFRIRRVIFLHTDHNNGFTCLHATIIPMLFFQSLDWLNDNLYLSPFFSVTRGSFKFLVRFYFGVFHQMLREGSSRSSSFRFTFYFPFSYFWVIHELFLIKCRLLIRMDHGLWDPCFSSQLNASVLQKLRIFGEEFYFSEYCASNASTLINELWSVRLFGFFHNIQIDSWTDNNFTFKRINYNSFKCLLFKSKQLQRLIKMFYYDLNISY